MASADSSELAALTAAARESALIGHLVAAGYARAEPAILQPASVFLDLSGEDIRGHMFLTSDAAGQELCLRPEFTIPVSLAYLASPHAGREASYSYIGPVFRTSAEGPGEFIQGGLESFGRSDRDAADAEILTLALEAAAAAGAPAVDVTLGDTGLFARLLDALDLPPVWLRRIRRGHSLGQRAETIFNIDTNGNGEHAGLLGAIDGVAPGRARELVEDLLSIAGVANVGGRSAAEIAERFLERASLRAGAGLAAEKRGLIERFLAIEGDPDAASGAMRALADEARLDLGAVLDSFDARLNFVAARGLDMSRLTFAAAFGRHIDYYTGFVFEAKAVDGPDVGPLVGGGRYDRLLGVLGAPEDIAAVGAAIWFDRLQPKEPGTSGERP